MNMKGFSLVEVKVCCAIMAVVAAIGYPCLGGMKQNLALRKEIGVLYTNLQRAKVEAIKQNSHVVFQIVQGGYTIFVDDGAGGGKKGDWK